MTGPASRPVPPRRLGRQIGGLVFDIGVPIAVYYVLRGAGVLQPGGPRRRGRASGAGRTLAAGRPAPG